MKRRRFAALLTALIMLVSAVPAAFADGAATRQCVIRKFVEAVGKDSLPKPAADLSVYADADTADPEFAESLALAVGNGLIMGYEDNTLRPNNTVTRLEALVILGRCLPKLEAVREAEAFSDVPDWAAGEIERLFRAGIVNGLGNGLLGADDNVTDEQLDLLVSRIAPSANDGKASLKDDFYSAVNSDFLSSASLGENQLSVSPIDDTAELVEEQLEEIGRELAEKYSDRSYSGSNSLEEEAAKLYFLAYDSYNDAGELSSLLPLIEKIKNSASLVQLAELNGELIRDYRIPILIDFETPYKKTKTGQSRVLGGVYMDYAGAGFDSSFWENGGDEARGNYVKYLAEILELLDFPDSVVTAEKLAELNISVDRAGKTYTETVRAEVDSGAEDEEQYVFSCQDIFERYGTNENIVISSLGKLCDDFTNLELIMYDTAQFDFAINRLKAADIETLRAACAVNLVENLMLFMPKAYRDASTEYARTIYGGGTDCASAEMYATEVSSWLYGEYYELKYLEKYGNIDADKIASLKNEIMSCFENKFKHSSFISPSTSAKAISKLRKMKISIAEISDDSYYDNGYGDYFVLPRDAAALLDVALDAYGMYGGSFYSTYVCVNSEFPCYTVNAAYNRYSNSLYVFAGYLNEPMYSQAQTEEELLAGVGFTIAHEVSHAFDESGSLYDADGDYSQWWKEDDYRLFREKADALAEVYGGYATACGNPINGKLTSDENIADIIAMDCIITIAKEKNLSLDALFRAYAATWAEVRAPKYDEYCSAYDVHSDGKTRVNAVLSNFDEFYETYGIENGDGMYTAPENRVRFI